MKYKLVVLFCFLSVFCGSRLMADTASSKTFGAYVVHYSTFNSLFVDANIAKLHGLVRAKDQTLINISVQKVGSGQSVKADINATAKNLMQQVKAIDFKKIDEPSAVYYIGSLRHSNREIFHIKFDIQVAGEPAPFQFKLTKKLYTEP